MYQLYSNYNRDFSNETCMCCSHGAGWHGGALAELCWNSGLQTKCWCDYEGCKCFGFVTTKEIIIESAK